MAAEARPTLWTEYRLCGGTGLRRERSLLPPPHSATPQRFGRAGTILSRLKSGDRNGMQRAHPQRHAQIPAVIRYLQTWPTASDAGSSTTSCDGGWVPQCGADHHNGRTGQRGDGKRWRIGFSVRPLLMLIAASSRRLSLCASSLPQRRSARMRISIAPFSLLMLRACRE